MSSDEKEKVDDYAAHARFKATDPATDAEWRDEVRARASRLVDMTGIDAFMVVGAATYTLPPIMSPDEQDEFMVELYWAAQELFALAQKPQLNDPTA